MLVSDKSSSIKKKKILCFIKYYLPGYKYGGPIRSVANFVEKFGDEYDIHIVCSSHDASDNKPYEGIDLEKWNSVGKAKVFYLSNKISKFNKIYKLLSEIDYDVIYLNSFFTFTFSIFPLLVQYFSLISIKSCVIAPRGEFSRNAIKLKNLKKLIYIYLMKILGVYDHLCWQASSEFETNDIERELGSVAKNIIVAPDLIYSNWSIKNKISYNKSRCLKIVFLSRISPMKNLDFLIRAINKVSSDIELNILGPKEDLQYWEKCKNLLKKTPKNIKVIIGEQVLPERVQETFMKYDLFAFPTRGENFGHVIPESLSVGTPILLSDQTPWNHVKSLGIQIIPLNENDWTKSIEQWATLSEQELTKRKEASLIYAKKIGEMNQKSIIKNKELFEYKSSCLN